MCGLANNQLAEDCHGAMLRERGIVYAPDYVVNAGGVIYGSDDIFKTHDNSEAENKIRGIGQVLSKIFAAAEKADKPTSEIADYRLKSSGAPISPETNRLSVCYTVSVSVNAASAGNCRQIKAVG